MSRFDRFGLRRFRARDAVLSVLLAAVLLVLFEGPSVLKAGNEMNPGIGRTLVLAVGRPSDWIATQLPLAHIAHTATAWLNPEGGLNGPGGFSAAGAPAVASQIPPVTSAAFTPETIGEKPPARRPLHTLLVTGDSMSMPLDSDLAQRLIPKGVHVIQDPHIGTGISTTFVVDWGKLSVAQVKADHPDAVVVFIGANDGFPMTGPSGREIPCCGAEWAAIYAGRVRQMANTYRQAGVARVYWMTLPTPREQARQKIARVVNAAITVGAQPWASQVRVINTVPIFTPGEVYRDAMSIGGTQTIVRQADGIHLNEAGSSLLATVVLEAIQQDFTY
ncbi:MAG TPA: GDSL-type esterase/lipase family protein [Solirubrobacteraceae bacterium]|nr:GDSL-type esterase/lipase family protein [Solirubrobacteraceae bacterium]